MKRSPTIAELEETIRVIRKEYDFTDNATVVLMEFAIRGADPGVLTLYEKNRETGVEVTVSREYVRLNEGG